MELQIDNSIKDLCRQYGMTQEELAWRSKSYTRGGVFIYAKSPLGGSILQVKTL